MEVRIGVQYIPKELEVDLGDGVDKEAVQKEIDRVINGGGSMLWFTDKKGRRVGVVAEKIAFIEVDATANERRMGFVG